MSKDYICDEGKKAQTKLNVKESRLSAAETKRLKDCVQTYEEHRQHKADRQKVMIIDQTSIDNYRYKVYAMERLSFCLTSKKISL